MPAPNHPSAAAACATDRTQSVPPFAHHPGCAAPAPAEAPRCHPAPASRADRHDWPLHKQPTTRKEGRMPRSTHTYIHAHTHTRRVVSHHDCADAKPQLRCTQVRHAARTRGKDTWQRHMARTAWQGQCTPGPHRLRDGGAAASVLSNGYAVVLSAGELR